MPPTPLSRQGRRTVGQNGHPITPVPLSGQVPSSTSAASSSGGGRRVNSIISRMVLKDQVAEGVGATRMMRVCPMRWGEIFVRLQRFAAQHPCTPPSPPKPLIHGGWAFSNDLEKMQRWEDTVAWAVRNGCSEIVTGIPESGYYCVEKPTSYIVGPLGGPLCRPWDFEEKARPAARDLERHLESLQCNWRDIVGAGLGHITHPLRFTGRKARRLLVVASRLASPPWGGWSELCSEQTGRRTFTQFRAAINKTISPHEVDHIDFITE
jgi:hypothetical protein